MAPEHKWQIPHPNSPQGGLRTIWRPAGHGGRPFPEKMGASVRESGVVSPSMAEIPARYSFSGTHGSTGFKGFQADIQLYIGYDVAQTVNGLTDTVKGTPQHLLGNPNLQGWPGKPGMGIAQGHAWYPQRPV